MPGNLVAIFELEQGQELLPKHFIKCLYILDLVHSLKLQLEQLQCLIFTYFCSLAKSTVYCKIRKYLF